jgi:hypothetical protein
MDSFHWVLFSVCITRSKVFVFNSLYNTTDKSICQNVIELIKTTWTCLYDKYPGKFNKNLYVHYDWLVRVFAYSSILTLQ